MSDGTPSDGDVLTALIDEVFRLNGVLLAEGDALTSEAGLTGARWQILGRLGDGPATAAGIARRRGLRRQSVQEAVDRLERDGMLDKTPNPADRRAPLLVLTPRGRAALADIEPIRAAWADRRAASVPASDLGTALETLRRLREAIASDGEAVAVPEGRPSPSS